MRLILDTRIVLGLSTVMLAERHRRIAEAVANDGHDLCVSVASLWEIAIKARLGKLDPGMPLAGLPSFLEAGGISILTVSTDHVLAEVDPVPPTRDPFDRLLLAQCKIKDRRLLTVDRALVRHPLSAGPF